MIHPTVHGRTFSVIMGSSRIDSGSVALYTEERIGGTGKYPLMTRSKVEGGGVRRWDALPAAG